MVLRRRGQLAGVAKVHAHRVWHTYAHDWKVNQGNNDGLMTTGGWSSSRIHPRSRARLCASQFMFVRPTSRLETSLIRSPNTCPVATMPTRVMFEMSARFPSVFRNVRSTLCPQTHIPGRGRSDPVRGAATKQDRHPARSVYRQRQWHTHTGSSRSVLLPAVFAGEVGTFEGLRREETQRTQVGGRCGVMLSR